MKNVSIKRWITWCFLIILIVSVAASAGWSFFWTRRSSLESAGQRTGTCAEIMQLLLDHWTLDGLEAGDESKMYRSARRTARILCRIYSLDYIYIFTFDPETNYRHFVLCVAGDDAADQVVREERYLGAVVDDPPDDAELAILGGAKTLQKHVLDNQYGHEETWLLPYFGDDGLLRAVIGMDYGVEMEQQKILHNFLLITVPMVLAISLVFIVLLLLLRRRITDPIDAISESMNRFALNSSVKPERLGIKSRDEIGEIASSYEKMTEDISSYISNIEALTREKVETNLQLVIARRIQNGLVPEKTDLDGERFSLSARTSPAKSVGGDFYDCFMRDEKTVCIVMGDVSGKGISAAIFMAMAKTIIREKLLACLSPAQALNEANDELCDQNPEGLFATVFAGLMNVDTGRLHYANAGHTHPVILGEKPSFIVPESGIALGLFKDADLNDLVVAIGPGEGIMLYTDGITEAVSPQKLFFGEERLLEVLSDQPADSAEGAISRVVEAVESFSGGGDPFDDAAVLVLMRERAGTVRQSVPVAHSSFEEIRKTIFAAAGDTPATRQALLACDEALANIVSYSGARSLEFSCEREEGGLCVVFSDDGMPFDPTKEETEEKDFDLLDSGGMGLSLIRQIVSSQTYERKNGRNELTLRFSLSDPDKKERNQQ